jgi:hypothetical protein
MSFTLCDCCSDVSSDSPDEMTMTMLPNQSPEPMRVGALVLPTSHGLADVGILAGLSFGR